MKLVLEDDNIGEITCPECGEVVFDLDPTIYEDIDPALPSED